MIYVLGMRDEIPDNAVVIDTTSRSQNWSRGLSPFILGPCKLWGGHVSRRMENAWQYSKVYPEHVEWTPNGMSPWMLKKEAWLAWATAGWSNPRAVRYPMGKGVAPLCSYWETSSRLPLYYQYVPARKDIYISLYATAVRATTAFVELCRLARTLKDEGSMDIVLRDFDGYNHRELGLTLDQVVDNPNRAMGHAFVLALLLLEMGIE